MFNEVIKGYSFGVLYGLICLALALLLYKLGMPKKYTRKVVHILVGFEWIILYHYLGAGLHFLMVCIFFLLLLIIAYKMRLMPMISSDGENAPGTVYYAVAMSGVAIVGCFLPEVMLPFGMGIMCTSVGDGIAGVVGQLITKHNPKIYKNKSLLGSLANFVASFVSSLVVSSVYKTGHNVWECIALAALSVGLELVVGFGLDNIAITWGVTALAYAFSYVDGVNAYLVPILATPFVIAFVIEKKALTSCGVAVAILMDVIVTLAFGNFGFVIMISFFLGSICIDKVKKLAKKQGRTDETAKRGTRDAVQVVANGLVPTAFACAFVFSKGNPLFAVAFVASFAEAFADTAASGVGALSNKAFDIFRWRRCENGISGGMSVIGTIASLVASFALSALAIPLTNSAFTYKYFLVSAIAAFAGSVFDSFLGSVLQVKYRCTVCSVLTEKEAHCDTVTERAYGIPFVDNDVVNLASGFFSAILAVFILVFVI